MHKNKMASILKGQFKKVYIIAEIGVNHNGSLELALKSIDAASKAGANAVKFQSYKVENFVSIYAEKANYQKQNSGSLESQYEMLKRYEITQREQIILKDYCEKMNIDFLATPFDEETAVFLNKIGVHAYKIGSGDLTNIPLIRKVDDIGLPIILSTGMASLSEIDEALDNITNSDVALLHCTSNYPAPLEDINLRAMVNMHNTFNKIVGYSDHTLGFEVSLGAVALGAKIIEKHFTLDKNFDGPDHKASLNPDEFKLFVNSIRNIEKSLGDGKKRCMPSELSTRDVARKSLVINKNIDSGEIITKDNLSIKRPGYGIAPKFFDLMIGRTVKRNMKQDQILTWDDVL
jgi:N,N'-diacetyllegionaminate synthase